jgi:hypothetical protein
MHMSLFVFLNIKVTTFTSFLAQAATKFCGQIYGGSHKNFVAGHKFQPQIWAPSLATPLSSTSFPAAMGNSSNKIRLTNKN